MGLDILEILCRIMAVCLWTGLLIVRYRFVKELKGGQPDTKNTDKLERYCSIMTRLIVFASLFSIFTLILRAI